MSPVEIWIAFITIEFVSFFHSVGKYSICLIVNLLGCSMAMSMKVVNVRVMVVLWDHLNILNIADLISHFLASIHKQLNRNTTNRKIRFTQFSEPAFISNRNQTTRKYGDGSRNGWKVGQGLTTVCFNNGVLLFSCHYRRNQN